MKWQEKSEGKLVFAMTKELYINKTLKLTQGDDGFYRDESGVIYALPNTVSSLDEVTRCGVGILSLPENHKLTAACRAHDYAYSSPVYQAFHTRREADKMLERHAALLGYSATGKVFRVISRIFGSFFWEKKM